MNKVAYPFMLTVLVSVEGSDRDGAEAGLREFLAQKGYQGVNLQWLEDVSGAQYPSPYYVLLDHSAAPTGQRWRVQCEYGLQYTLQWVSVSYDSKTQPR